MKIKTIHFDIGKIVVLIILALCIFAMGLVVGIMVTSYEFDAIVKDYSKLEVVVEGYANRSFHIMLEGRKLEIWDSLGLIDSVGVIE